MKAATVKELKTALEHQSKEQLTVLCLQLAKFKKENKELLTYLLYEAGDEEGYIESVKLEIKEQFTLINTTSYFYIKKSIRRILRMVKKYIRYSKKKETEVELLICFCRELREMKPSITRNQTLQNLFNRQVLLVKKAIATLHEDLQYDYNQELNALL